MQQHYTASLHDALPISKGDGRTGERYIGDICSAHCARVVCDRAGLARRLRKYRDGVGAGVDEGGRKSKGAVYRNREVIAAVVLQHHAAGETRGRASNGKAIGRAWDSDVADADPTTPA